MDSTGNGETGQTGTRHATSAKTRHFSKSRSKRYIGIDAGTETLRMIELIRTDGRLNEGRYHEEEHAKNPEPIIRRVLADWNWPEVTAAAVTGRLSRAFQLSRIPSKQAQATAFRHMFPGETGTIVSIGSHGFSVLELHENGLDTLRENSRCAQGTGNFLRQLVERFNMTIEEACAASVEVDDPAPLSGRCPVILKTDMTHLANKGEDRAKILAGLFDAVCQNVLNLIKPEHSPEPVVLAGGVSRSERVQNVFREQLSQRGLTFRGLETKQALFLDALGAALNASTQEPASLPALNQLLKDPEPVRLNPVPKLATSLPRIKRMKPVSLPLSGSMTGPVLLGFDIGSTGSKLVAIDQETLTMTWEGYRSTSGDPAGAAQALLQSFLEEATDHGPLVGFGVTGSGREIVGSLLSTCYGVEQVFVLNEIAAHAHGALHFNPQVDTIFEIGGQDAKYIRLSEGRIIDCAMNEACSAGTGSFIEEQGRKFSGIRDVKHLAQEAMNASSGVSLGQHCSVFMAEIIDEAVAGGVAQPSIIAGLYDSIIQNYLNRVKGNRSVGKLIFCQGMPFASDALAAAVVRQTGSPVVVPPNPGTVGAFGIALLTARELSLRAQPLDPEKFLGSHIESKKTFICKSTVGCGGSGNHCRIDTIRTLTEGQQQRFTWGGACSLYDKGALKQKLPDRSPNPFREREECLQQVLEPALNARRAGHPTIGLTDEFVLKGLAPFFVTFFHELGLDPVMPGTGTPAMLKRGIQDSHISFCAPMQLYQGMASSLVEQNTDFLFLPMLRSLARPVDGQGPESVTCPIAQGSSDIIKANLDTGSGPRILDTVMDMGIGNLRSKEWLASCQELAADLGQTGQAWRNAHARAMQVQETFEASCLEIGRKALEFARQKNLQAVVVLGRPYTIYNKVLNSNVPSILREQGALAVPLDCYPVSSEAPTFQGMYWGYGQRILRAVHQVRRSPGVYAVYCSNYSCGPDSFNLHFASYGMQGKPFTVIETDGHSGDAGTRTRIEAFLYCVREKAPARAAQPCPNDFLRMQVPPMTLKELEKDEILLVPRLGAASETITAAFQGLGLPARNLPFLDTGMLELGRRHTSGKECVPITMILGTLLHELQKEENTANRFVVVLPSSEGPCRFGVYNLLHQIILESTGWRNRVRFFSPLDRNYFVNLPPGFPGLALAGIAAADTLRSLLLQWRPGESMPGRAEEIYLHWHQKLLELIRRQASSPLSRGRLLKEVATGALFGITHLLQNATREFMELPPREDLPTVLVVGEIYVRTNNFSNDNVIEKLEKLGLRTKLAPVQEWLEYSDYLSGREGWRQGVAERISSLVFQRILNLIHATASTAPHHQPHRHKVQQSLTEARPLLRDALYGEAALTLGSSLAEWKEGLIDGVVNIGPLECMPTKVAETQFHHAANRVNLLSLTLPVNGDPVDPQVLENFAFEIHTRHRSGSLVSH